MDVHQVHNVHHVHLRTAMLRGRLFQRRALILASLGHFGDGGLEGQGGFVAGAAGGQDAGQGVEAQPFVGGFRGDGLRAIGSFVDAFVSEEEPGQVVELFGRIGLGSRSLRKAPRLRAGPTAPPRCRGSPGQDRPSGFALQRFA